MVAEAETKAVGKEETRNMNFVQLSVFCYLLLKPPSSRGLLNYRNIFINYVSCVVENVSDGSVSRVRFEGVKFQGKIKHSAEGKITRLTLGPILFVFWLDFAPLWEILDPSLTSVSQHRI